MSLRYVSIAFIALAWIAADAALADQSTATSDSGCQSRQVVSRTVVVTDQEAKPAPMATWWNNSAVGKFCRSVVRDSKRLNCWPEPFPRADREAVRMPFVRMVANGWELQNTLGDHNFDPQTGKLNRSGQLKIRYILLEGLPEHRFVFIHRAEQGAATAARVESVQQYVAQTVRDGPMPPIFETDIPSPGMPAQRVDAVDRKFGESMPSPRLPASTQGGGGQSM